ncbi:MAG: hypothetical protein V2G44_02160 [bacterium JZ-2024 1]
MFSALSFTMSGADSSERLLRSGSGVIPSELFLIVGSLKANRLKVLHIRDGLPAATFDDIHVPSASVITIATGANGAIAVVTSDQGPAFRLIWTDGKNLEIGETEAGLPAHIIVQGNDVLIHVLRGAGQHIVRYHRQPDYGFIRTGQDIQIESGEWIWRASGNLLVGVGLTQSSRISLLIWNTEREDTVLKDLPPPDTQPHKEWLELYDAQFSRDAEQVMVTAEWGMDGGGPADRGDYLLLFDIRAQVVRDIRQFSNLDVSSACRDATLIRVADSLVEVSANGERCGQELPAEVVHSSTDGTYIIFGAMSAPASHPLRKSPRILEIPEIVPLAPLENLSFGTVGDTVWFSGVLARMVVTGGVPDHIRIGIAGTYRSGTGQWWIYDPRGEWLFSGNARNCRIACGLFSRVLDRTPASPDAPTDSVIQFSWVLAIDRVRSIPCLYLTHKDRVIAIRPLLDRRGEFPYSPSQEWDYTGLFRTLSYRAPQEYSRTEICSHPDEILPGSGAPDVFLGSMLWLEHPSGKDHLLLVFLGAIDSVAQRLVGYQVADGARPIENGRASEGVSDLSLSFSLEGEEFKIQGGQAGHWTVVRRYHTYPRNCSSSVPGFWEDVFQVSREGTTYAGSKLTLGEGIENLCLRREGERAGAGIIPQDNGGR